MPKPEPLPTLSREELLALVAELQRQIAALQAEIDELKRGGKRQAAPLAKGARVTEPKRPGRKPGSGSFRDREAPRPDAITDQPVDVQVSLDACPACEGPLAEERVDFAYRTELPARPRPQVTRYCVWVCRCTVCGPQVLHDGVGIPVRNVPKVLAALTGVQLTQGALTQDALRRALGARGTAYEQLRGAVPTAPVVHTDDTGWRVGGEPSYLMAFETDAATVYQIRSRHRHEEVQEVLPTDDAGVMVTDRGRSDDARAFEGVAQHKCLAHILRSIDDGLATKKGRTRDFGEQLKALLQEALALWHEHRDGRVPDVKAEAEALQAEVTYQLRDRCLKDADHQRLLNELGWHHDGGSLLRFLADPRVEPTNNRAERALRPAVIARKVSQCSKNTRGADAFAAFTSVIRTLMKTGVGSLVDALAQLFHPTQPQHLPT